MSTNIELPNYPVRAFYGILGANKLLADEDAWKVRVTFVREETKATEQVEFLVSLVSRRYVIFYRIRKAQEVIGILRYWHAPRGELEFE